MASISHVIVDAENVRRSIWPNVSGEELVRRCGDHAAAESVEVTIVFDGAPPACATPDRVALVGERGRSADDLIAELVVRISGEVVVATSDRGLRARLPADARLVGGGAFVRRLVRE